VDDTGTDQDQKNTGDDESTGDAPAADDDRLDELGDRIQSVRAEAEDVVEGMADIDDDTYADSGDEKSTDEDDQTIAPPG